MEPDIYIKVRFRTTEEGGRRTSLKCKEASLVNFYACPLKVDGKLYDCRLTIDEEIVLGRYYEVPVKFLNKDSVMSSLYIGKSVTLLEGKEVADGQVVKICG